MRESQDIGSRIIIGTALILAGALIHLAFILALPKPVDVFGAIGYVFAVVAYGTVANLLVLLGLEYYFGPGGWFRKHVANSLRHLVVISGCK
ncbi:MAG: hypothetical protein ACYST6_07895 [Planctomycetota bacterium]|jgi:hypothetical protein